MVDHWFAAPNEPFSGAEAPSNRVIRRTDAASSSAAKKLSAYRWAVAGLSTAALAAPVDFVVGMRGAGLETFIKNKTPQPLSVGHRSAPASTWLISWTRRRMVRGDACATRRCYASRMESPPLTAQEKLQLAFEMHELGCAMMRQTLLRRFPDETDADRERRFVEWLQTRPGAEHGDAPGRSRPLP